MSKLLLSHPFPLQGFLPVISQQVLWLQPWISPGLFHLISFLFLPLPNYSNVDRYLHPAHFSWLAIWISMLLGFSLWLSHMLDFLFLFNHLILLRVLQFWIWCLVCANNVAGFLFCASLTDKRSWLIYESWKTPNRFWVDYHRTIRATQDFWSCLIMDFVKF